ncbi:universal stress protein [Permianibacter aggregans]|uniref:Nucleotide-binding universal stress UspA family protein n=1 Tax=Permianibacter aggregans TaxID=1510150 RepID=A0A4R6UPZ8_9GAMM|nr:universal stress protein [Permianibacter aggregans]TDQ48266.1 nucleotide-binding universal stress UspA family protein [Permianibacter aggregans]
MYKKILVPVDGSELSDESAKEAVKLAKNLGSELCFYHANVVAIPPMMAAEVLQGGQTVAEIFSETQEAHGKKVLAQAAKFADQGGIKFSTYSSSAESAWQGVVSAAKKQECDLIVMASHGRRGLKSLLLGSETHHVLTHSTIPVLVQRPKS